MSVHINTSFVLLFTVFCCSCKTIPENKTEHSRSAAAGPGTCNIEGRIVRITKQSDIDTGSICSKYPCRATVKINEVFGCGSAVAVPLTAGDTIEMKFAYTLHSTEVIPGMKAHYPGLKEGDVFIATVSQRLVMGGSGEFVIYDYEMRE